MATSTSLLVFLASMTFAGKVEQLPMALLLLPEGADSRQFLHFVGALTQDPRLPSLFHRGKTLYKHGRLGVPTSTLSAAESESTNSDSWMQARPLRTVCDVMPQFVSALNSIFTVPYNCMLSGPPCNPIFCNVSTGDLQQITHLPCNNPPALQIIVWSPGHTVLTNVTISESGPVSINYTNATIQTNFTIVQHSQYLTLGESVSC